MQALGRNKKEYLKTVKLTLCSACLSSDRKLFVLDEFDAIYKLICKKNVSKDLNSGTLFCWECLALLRNVKKFQEKVQKSQKALESYLKDSEKNQLKSISTLSTTETDVFHSINPIEAKCESKVDIKVNTGIKEETEEFSDNFLIEFEPLEEIKDDSPEELSQDSAIPFEYSEINAKIEKTEDEDICQDDLPEENIIKEPQGLEQSNDFDDVDFGKEEIKEEIKPKTKSNKLRSKRKNKKLLLNKDRSELYKIIELKHSTVNAYKRVAIKPHEISYWREREINSDYFKNLTFKCEKCVVDIRQARLQDHEKYHTKLLKYMCDICEMHFASRTVLYTHIKHHYYIRSCTKCEFMCIGKHHMYWHFKKAHSERRIVQCLHCNSQFRSTRVFYDHYRAVHFELNHSFYCDYCNKKCMQKRTIEDHIFRHHTTHTCAECNTSFSKYRAYKTHIHLKHRIELSEATYCVTCDRQFNTVLAFKNHFNWAVAHAKERKTVEKKKFQCPACPNVYAKRTGMMNHYNKYHAEKARFFCADCDKTFLNNSKLRDHIKYRHEGQVRERRHLCTICGRKFTTSKVLVNHIRTHTGERPYECAHCPAKFAQRTAMLTHTNNIHGKRERNGI